MRRKTIALALALLVLASVLPPGAAAEAEAPGQVVFETGAADADGVFTVTMRVSDMTVWGIQFALKYDPAVIEPVKANGDSAETFDDFAGVVQDWTDTVNKDFYPDLGLLGSAWIIPPGNTGTYIDGNGDAVVGSEPLDVFTFRFKRLKDGDTGLDLATEAAGRPYQDVIPEGIIAGSLAELEFPVEVTFRDADAPESARSRVYTPAVPEAPKKTADELLEESVILKLNSHAAVVEGGVCAIYYGERSVTAYAHDDRTFVPVRFVGERLGATVSWDNDSRTVTVEKDGRKVEMTIGSSTYSLNGEEKTLDAPAELTPSTDGNSRTMVPIRFVSEALGYQVEWDQARDLVVIVPPSVGWDPAGETEAQAMDKAVTNLALYSNFV